MKYYLIYRVPAETPLCDAPLRPATGGIVDCAGLELSEVHDIAMMRYHAGSHEYVVTRQVFTELQQTQAEMLCEQWETEMSEFVELMQA